MFASPTGRNSDPRNRAGETPFVLLWAKKIKFKKKKKGLGGFQLELLKISHLWNDKCRKHFMFWLINGFWTSSFAHGMYKKNSTSTHSANFKHQVTNNRSKSSKGKLPQTFPLSFTGEPVLKSTEGRLVPLLQSSNLKS